MKFTVIFRDRQDVINRLKKTAQCLLHDNLQEAVSKATLFAVTVIAKDTPVDTGRLRASVGGELSAHLGFDLGRSAQAIIDGKKQSLTEIKDLEGRIGTNVEYAPYILLNKKRASNHKLTAAQLRFLFATGVLKSENGKVVYMSKKKARRRGALSRNLPLIRKYHRTVIDQAIDATLEGRRFNSV